MTGLSICVDLLVGWVVWSLSHNLGHRWWHVEMRSGKNTPYAHGEREHHRVYDAEDRFEWQQAEDPQELFISFPFRAIAPIGLIFVAGYGWLRGWEHSPAFAITMYASMIVDHRLHTFFHKSAPLKGMLGRLQQMHQIHHRTHRNNFFFVTGLPWDVLFGTAQTKLEKTSAADCELETAGPHPSANRMA